MKADPPDALLNELREHKAELVALLSEPPKPAARFSDLYATEADYARRLVAYARQDGVLLQVRNGKLAMGYIRDPRLFDELRKHEKAALYVLAKEGQ